MQKDPIVLKKVSVHNLKKVDLTLTPNELIVFTGVSGSGKSSLAFDTIYTEGQRRYIESLSHQARRYLSDLPKPEAESISGIAPTIAIEQKTTTRTPRSTVGTLTGIYDFLRVLYAKIATPYCPLSQEPVQAMSREKIQGMVQEVDEGEKFIVLVPYAKGKKGEFKEDFQELLTKGYTKLRIDGNFVDLSDEIHLDGKASHDIDIVVDRLVGKDKSRIKEAVSAALELGKGFFSLFFPETGVEKDFSQFAYSKKSNLSYGPLEPHDFSFNHPLGMCPSCQGLGVSSEFDLEKVIDKEKSLSEDCCAIASSYQTVRYGNIYDNLAKLYDFSLKTPWKKLSEKAKKVFLYGTEKKWTSMRFIHPVKKTRWTEYVQWRGALHEAKERLINAKSDSYRKKMGDLMIEMVCPACLGSRIKPYPREARLNGKKIGELTALSLADALNFFEKIELTEIEMKIGESLIKEIKERLKFLIYVGLSYLTLDRTSPTLSGGESQRVRLAAQIGSSLVGAIYVLDEPSIGLHPSDHHKLIDTLLELRNQGNTVIVVEHDLDTIFAADTVVDVGPGAGQHGGEILACGTPQEVMQNPRSLTGAYLSGRLSIEIPKRKKLIKSLEILGAKHHNLQSVDVKIPLGGLIAVTGVSGSGKSSLITDILYPALSNHLMHSQLPVGAHKKINGIEEIDKIIAVDQSPIGRTPRSNAATYIKLFDEIRDLFASLPESQVRGFDAGHFSFNVKEGSCPYCSGLGQVKIDMDFMEDAWVDCPQCKGRRFDPEILAVQYRGKSISDILNTDVEGALSLFDSIPTIRKKLELLSLVGLDYLTLGQPSTTLSGGEAQRIKLAKELVRPPTGKTIYILDEPTTGLHFHDIKRLISVLTTLVEKGNTVVVIEHNLDLIKCADWIIDLGPKAGIYGGTIVGEGPPEKIAKLKTATGEALKALFSAAPYHKSENREKGRLSPFDAICVEGASENNLKAVNASILRNQISVFTGPSGSGKSSLAFDTLYAEGQRRYTETLSPYARSLIKQLPKPKADRIEGLSPSIALEQKTGGLNPRSTIGTITEIYDLLRILYAHLGTPYDPETKEMIRHISKEEIVARLLSLPKEEKVHILSPLVFEKKESFEKLLERVSRQGFLRIRLNGKFFEIDEKIEFDPFKKNELHLVIDRLVIGEKIEKRLFEAVEKATVLSDGIVVIARQSEDLHFNLAFSSITTGKAYPPITPQTFSFNHDAGMCLECQGLGSTYGAHLAEEKSFLRYSLLDVLDRFFKEKGSSGAYKIIEKYFVSLDVDLKEPLKNLPTEKLHLFLHGGEEKSAKGGLILRWIGLEPLLSSLVRIGSQEVKEALLPKMKADRCPACEGSRLNPLARNVLIENRSIADFCSLPIEKGADFISRLKLDKGKEFLQETKSKIEKNLHFLLSIGLGYLSLDRSAPTLSGGELQRIRLARQLGSGLTSCLYVLDEPTIGLHPYNNELLNHALQNLKELGNTIVLVEHDPMTIEKADYIFDFGPKAGLYGGEITAFGTPKEIKENPLSLTGAYLSGKKKIPYPKKRRPFSPDIRILNGSLHNLKNVSIAIAYGAITCLTGVSGSGKSTLVRHLLKPAAEAMVNRPKRKKGEPLTLHGASFYGLEPFEKVITIDQSPIGQTIRADVSTYTEVQPLIRSLFASLPKASAKGLQGRHFSPNHLRGMCRTCWGLGVKKIDLQFMPKVLVPCEACQGNRLNPVSLEIEYKGKHFGEVLKMNIEEALLFFSAIPRIVKRLALIESVGLSYLKLGQEVVSLSGGEAQRLRLTRELAKRETGKTLYLIDEPTVGLHFSDIEKLLPIFHKLADKKNTLVIIEHNLDFLTNADYIIDLGPGAGEKGGEVLAMGTPEEVAKNPSSFTGKYLRELL